MNRETLRQVRKAAGYSHERMAQILGYSTGYYRNIESGSAEVPKSIDGPFLLLKLSRHHKDVIKTSEVLVGF